MARNYTAVLNMTDEELRKEIRLTLHELSVLEAEAHRRVSGSKRNAIESFIGGSVALSTGLHFQMR